MSHRLSEQRFQSFEDVEKWVKEWIESEEEAFYRHGVRLLGKGGLKGVPTAVLFGTSLLLQNGPDGLVHVVKIGGVRRPFIRIDEVGQVLATPPLYLLGLVKKFN
ncbi:hypothetical protein ANCDUO_10982 [Ancylostoma duodenale]|uniref:Uncharacterized protein n=1 Tax=Ancylostoma duodenale TaxID=51022 RepID=A0A0C2CPW8_9BILA|nr:hypothetical protein ANCDUO_10982 [Ancylostoma duodenale]